MPRKNQCNQTSKQTGKRCKNHAVYGKSTCIVHMSVGIHYPPLNQDLLKKLQEFNTKRMDELNKMTDKMDEHYG